MNMNKLTILTLTAVLLAPLAAQHAAEPCVAWPVRIEKGTFVDARGQPFAPRGFNYVRLFPGRSHNTFDPERYDTAAVEEALQRWETDGFNVVRVFLNSYAHLPGSLASKGRPGLSESYIRNVADFLGRARQHGIGVMICTESFPRAAPYSDALRPLQPTVSAANAEYLDARHVEAKARWLKALIAAIDAARPGCLDAVFSYDLQNELCFHGSSPFTLESGTVVTASGKTYTLPAQRQELADDAAVHFINSLADAIHEAHPSALVSASVFTYAAVGRSGPGDFTVKEAGWQNRIPFRPLAILGSKADFLDLHFYASSVLAFEQDLATVEYNAVHRRARELGKPLFVGEFGVFKRAFPDIESAAVWMGTLASEFSRQGFSGWLYWTYDTHEQDKELWHACDRNGAIYRRLMASK